MGCSFRSKFSTLALAVLDLQLPPMLNRLPTRFQRKYIPSELIWQNERANLCVSARPNHGADYG
jgi:hypothetical protein